MTDVQFQQLISAIEQSNKTHWWEYVIDALIAALVAVVVTYSMEGIRSFIESRLVYNNLLVIKDNIAQLTKELKSLGDLDYTQKKLRSPQMLNYMDNIIEELNSAKSILIDFKVESDTLQRSLDAIIYETENQRRTIIREINDTDGALFENIQLIYNKYEIFLLQFKGFSKNLNIVYLLFDWTKFNFKKIFNSILRKK
ncbi:hypothetical protein ACNNMX_01885 [Aerococcus viridans]|uniref:hypothetical protein n=1 Tax=Aerococcus viridans TaxID=1377 RepID=UPI003AA8A7CD